VTLFSQFFLIQIVTYHVAQGGDEEKFKLVVEANAVLSDPQRRDRYDMGEDEDGMNDSSGGMGGMGGMDLSELFAQFHGGGGGTFRSSGGARGHTHGFAF
jgi:DnaJ family protein C protein 7